MLEKVLSFVKIVGIVVFVLVWIDLLIISVKVIWILDKVQVLSNNANEVIVSTKPIVKKTHQLTDLAVKDLKVVDWNMSKVTPLLEKTNNLLDTANVSMKTVDGSLHNVQPLLKKTNKFMWLANETLTKLQPSIELLKNTTSGISWVLWTTNGYLKMILGKLKF